MFKLSGKRPATLGSKNGKLAPVVKKPNNVSSQADVNDRAHYVAPLKFTGDAAVAFQKLLKIVQSQPRTSVVTQDGQYLHAEFSSPLMGFVDDVEFVLAPEQGGHVGFISHRPRGSTNSRLHDTDRFWAENRVIEFCKLAGGNV